jgi:hypothetical protein
VIESNGTHLVLVTEVVGKDHAGKDRFQPFAGLALKDAVKLNLGQASGVNHSTFSRYRHDAAPIRFLLCGPHHMVRFETAEVEI